MMWSWEKPTEPGWYYVNRGDVVTSDSFEAVLLIPAPSGQLIDRDLMFVEDYSADFKFMPIDINGLNQINNKD